MYHGKSILDRGDRKYKVQRSGDGHMIGMFGKKGQCDGGRVIEQGCQEMRTKGTLGAHYMDL